MRAAKVVEIESFLTMEGIIHSSRVWMVVNVVSVASSFQLKKNYFRRDSDYIVVFEIPMRSLIRNCRIY